jgi:hypothetical protein
MHFAPSFRSSKQRRSTNITHMFDTVAAGPHHAKRRARHIGIQQKFHAAPVGRE